MQRGNLRDCWGVSLVYRQVKKTRTSLHLFTSTLYTSTPVHFYTSTSLHLYTSTLYTSTPVNFYPCVHIQMYTCTLLHLCTHTPVHILTF